MITPGSGTFRPGNPYQQAANGIPAIKGLHQAAHLVPVPDISPLKLGESNTAQVDLVQNGGDFHA